MRAQRAVPRERAFPAVATVFAILWLAVGCLRGPAAASLAEPQIDRVSRGAGGGGVLRREAVPQALASSWKGQIDLGMLGSINGGEAVVAALRAALRGNPEPQRIVRLAIDRRGAIAGCAAFLPQPDATPQPQSDGFSAELCSALRAHLSYEPMPGFVMPGPVAYLTLDLAFIEVPALTRPVVLAPGRKGVRITIAGLPMAPAGDCLLDARGYGAATQAAICKLWREALHARDWRASDGKPVGPYDSTAIYLERAPIAEASEVGIDIHRPVLAWPNEPVFEPLEESPNALVKADGHLALPISSDDYPAAALRSALQGVVRMELRFADTKRVVSCRPVTSSGSSELDNAGCRLALRRGRWFPAPGAPAFADRPIRANVRWALAE